MIKNDQINIQVHLEKKRCAFQLSNIKRPQMTAEDRRIISMVKKTKQKRLFHLKSTVAQGHDHRNVCLQTKR